MKIRGIEFNNVFNCSGALGFFGEGWWFHWLWKIFFFFGFKPEKLTLKIKTATWPKRAGNMATGIFAWLKNLFPACVVVKFFQQAVLNSVGLTNIGLEALIAKGYWQKIKKPFVISIMVVGETREERLKEMEQIVEALQKFLKAHPWLLIALEINVSCPNTKRNQVELAEEVLDYLRVAAVLDIPIVAKLNVFAKYELVKAIQDSDLCDAIVVTNTLPWGSFWCLIPWENLFGSKKSPLEKHGFGGGGLSGPWVFPFLVDWIYRMRRKGITMPLIAGGGIIRKQDILLLKLAGANAVEFGVGHFMFRPWAMESDRQYAEQIFTERQGGT